MSDELRNLLQTWRHEPSAAPEFNAGVWNRLRRADAAPAPILAFPRALPLAAGLAVLLSIAAGVGAGVAVNRSRTADQMAAAYARSIDPVLMAGLDAHHP